MRLKIKRALTRRAPNASVATVTPAGVHQPETKHDESSVALAADKTYFTIETLSQKLGADESEIKHAIRFGVLGTVKFPVRGAKRLRIEEGVARVFARRFYAKLI